MKKEKDFQLIKLSNYAYIIDGVILILPLFGFLELIFLLFDGFKVSFELLFQLLKPMKTIISVILFQQSQEIGCTYSKAVILVELSRLGLEITDAYGDKFRVSLTSRVRFY